MAFTAPDAEAIEMVGSRRGRSSADGSTEITYVYNTYGSDTLSTLIGYVNLVAPTSITDPVFPTVTLWREEVDWDQKGKELWEFRVNYVSPEAYDRRQKPVSGDYTFSFSTTGGTARITTAKAEVNRYEHDPQDLAPDSKKVLGAPGSSDIGLDIVVPALKFTVEYTHPQATITNSMVITWENMTGTVNDDTFWSRAAGEVLYLGAEGREGTKSDPLVAHNFLRMPNISGLSLGEISGIAKKGHEYLWVRFQEQETPTGLATVKIPRYAYVMRIYDEVDFSAIGIGT
jgi:hypothetical protein